MSCFKLRALISYLELVADIDETSLMTDGIDQNTKKRFITNNLKYQPYDPAYEQPPGIIGDESDMDLELFAANTLRKIEIHKPETALAVPKYLYRIMSLLYT